MCVDERGTREKMPVVIWIISNILTLHEPELKMVQNETRHSKIIHCCFDRMLSLPAILQMHGKLCKVCLSCKYHSQYRDFFVTFDHTVRQFFNLIHSTPIYQTLWNNPFNWSRLLWSMITSLGFIKFLSLVDALVVPFTFTRQYTEGCLSSNRIWDVVETTTLTNSLSAWECRRWCREIGWFGGNRDNERRMNKGMERKLKFSSSRRRHTEGGYSLLSFKIAEFQWGAYSRLSYKNQEN